MIMKFSHTKRYFNYYQAS